MRDQVKHIDLFDFIDWCDQKGLRPSAFYVLDQPLVQHLLLFE